MATIQDHRINIERGRAHLKIECTGPDYQVALQELGRLTRTTPMGMLLALDLLTRLRRVCGDGVEFENTITGVVELCTGTPASESLAYEAAIWTKLRAAGFVSEADLDQMGDLRRAGEHLWDEIVKAFHVPAWLLGKRR